MGICCTASPYQNFALTRIHGIQCCSGGAPNAKKNANQTPKLLKVAVSGVTELLRLFSPANNINELGIVNDQLCRKTLVFDIDDIITIIKSDYERAYFVTGLFTSEIYADDCIFEDPTIKFRGKDLYSRNLKLLVPFFDNPSIMLKNIEKGNSTTDRIVASWKLRTYLKIPWRPLISVDGTTVYDLDYQLRVVRHVESWSISALEAISQIFTPSIGKYDE